MGPQDRLLGRSLETDFQDTKPTPSQPWGSREGTQGRVTGPGQRGVLGAAAQRRCCGVGRPLVGLGTTDKFEGQVVWSGILRHGQAQGSEGRS